MKSTRGNARQRAAFSGSMSMTLELRSADAGASRLSALARRPSKQRLLQPAALA
ncbi:hypothetical protein OEJ37_29140 [Burkholderia sp. BKH01]|uniref:hypothetical protein n=1 Tax=Burkholderia sp. BKH01 TaxID=2769262 RepID=UPI0021E0EC1E|nr:hypothetical protein [Burkholderia sp. BKH01]MCU9957430.1 hypothetical protein [Burkholderia sp. BKH01]